jgi:hypothetical protein
VQKSRAALKDSMRKDLKNHSTVEGFTASGIEVLVPTHGPMAAIVGSPLYFAILAYMSEVEQRDRFIAALRSSQLKGFMKPRGIPRPRSLRAAFPKMRQRKAIGILNMGRKRIHHRVTIGSLAWSVFAGNGVRFFYQHPTPDGKIGQELYGVSTLTDGVRELLRQKASKLARYIDPDIYPNPAVSNEMHIWVESMPVLHLAMAVCAKFQALDPNLSDDDKLFCLIHSSEWLFDTVKFAEEIRPILQSRIPRFDPSKAIRLLPA